MTHLSPLLIVRVPMSPFEALDPLAGDRARLVSEEWLRRLEDRAAEAEQISNLLYDAAGETATLEQASARGAALKLRRAIHQGRAVGCRVMEEAGSLLT